MKIVMKKVLEISRELVVIPTATQTSRKGEKMETAAQVRRVRVDTVMLDNRKNERVMENLCFGTL